MGCCQSETTPIKHEFNPVKLKSSHNSIPIIVVDEDYYEDYDPKKFFHDEESSQHDARITKQSLKEEAKVIKNLKEKLKKGSANTNDRSFEEEKLSEDDELSISIDPNWGFMS